MKIQHGIIALFCGLFCLAMLYTLDNIAKELHIIATPPAGYEVRIGDSTIDLYSGNRFVYGYKTNWQHGLDSALNKDNE